jgi:hypothetical protein
MDTELLEFIVNWRMGLIILLVFGFAPGALLRLVVRAFRRGDPRRSEMLAELHRVPRLERPLWVVEQTEVALFEGILERVKALGKRRRGGQETSLIHRREHVGLPSGSLWPRIYSDYEDSEGVQRLLTGEKASAFILRESLESTPEVDAVLYFPNTSGWSTLGTVCSFRVRHKDLPTLLRLIKETQGLIPMSTEQWQTSVGGLGLAGPTKQVRRTGPSDPP